MRKYLIAFSPFIIFTLFFTAITYFYYQRIGSFGCFDDCFNYMGGYFLLKGKVIYSEFFYNHQPLMAYFSYFIQKISSPSSIYQLILYHRLFIYLFSFLMGIILIFRFKWNALAFLLVFESTKFYLFGDRFLAEGFIIYPFVYLFGITWLKIGKKAIKTYDYILSGIFAWFVIFMREPFIPVGVLLYLLIIFNKSSTFFPWSIKLTEKNEERHSRNKLRGFKEVLDKNEVKPKVLSFFIFGILTAGTLFLFPIQDYILNLFTFNQKGTGSEISSHGGVLANIITALFYPIYVFITGEKSIFRYVLIVTSIMFLDVLLNLFKRKEFKQILLIILVLGLSNIRFTAPGTMYFQAFHMLIWYGLFIFAIFLCISEWIRKEKKFWIIMLPVFLITIYSLLSKDSFLKKTDKMLEFNNSYANEYAYGTGIKLLSKSTDTLFLEGTHDLIYWVADLNTSYKYGWYTSIMPYIDKYSSQRTAMFIKNSPDFYYDACKLLKQNNLKPTVKEINRQYLRLLINSKPSCLLIKKDKIKTISDERWNSVKPLGFSLK